MRYSSHMTEKDRDIPFKERWRVIPAGIENPTLGDVRKRYLVISAGLLALSLTVGAAFNSHTPAPPEKHYPTPTPTAVLADTYESCMQDARTKLLDDPAAATADAQDCRQEHPIVAQSAAGTLPTTTTAS